MKVRFNVNVGINDARKVQLDYRDCTRGAVLEVSENVGRQLVSRRLADVVPEEIHAVPPVEELRAVPESFGTVERVDECQPKAKGKRKSK